MKKSLVTLICLCAVLCGCSANNDDTSLQDAMLISVTEDPSNSSPTEQLEQSSKSILRESERSSEPSQDTNIPAVNEPLDTDNTEPSKTSTEVMQATEPTQPATTQPNGDKNADANIQKPMPTVKPTVPTNPKPKDPVEASTTPTVPVTTEPSATEPEVKPTETVPPVTEPAVTVPDETTPAVTEPKPTEPSVTEPPETEPPTENIDIAALESYGRSYASGTYGYNGTSACHPGTGAGYFPAATKKISTMEEGYSIVRQAIDSQYNRDCAYGYTPYEEIDGQIVRCPINVSVTSGGDNTYSITVYYGGTA